MGSGNVVHNLSRIDWNRPDEGFDWARRFDEAVLAQMETAPADLLRAVEQPDYEAAVPTPEHFIPLLYVAGLAATEGSAAAILRGYSMGSLSMTCYGVGVDTAACETGDGSAALPLGVPPDQTNT